MKSLYARLRSHRLASTFLLLATHLRRHRRRLIRSSRSARTGKNQRQQRCHPSQGGQLPHRAQRLRQNCQGRRPCCGQYQHPDPSQNRRQQGWSPSSAQPTQPRPAQSAKPGRQSDDDDQTIRVKAKDQGKARTTSRTSSIASSADRFPIRDDGDDGQVRESLGSGFIVDPKGYIITNNHVIEKADKIFVKLSTDPDSQDLGRPARVIGTDKATDLAVIKIESSSPLPTVKLGNSDQAQVGDWVEAIGSPFALAQTVTAGIISAKNRTIEPGVAGQFQHFIQTDAAINPGNSGGPLLNMNGEVIGVNTAIYTQSAGYQGIGFAMPSNTVVSVYNDLISPSHKVTRGSIGISFRSGLSGAVNRVYGFKNGVLVQQVQPGGPADKGGIKPGDIITSIDGRSIKDGDDLVNDIASRRPGSSIRLGFMRDGKPQDATVTVGDRDKVFADLHRPETGSQSRQHQRRRRKTRPRRSTDHRPDGLPRSTLRA